LTERSAPIGLAARLAHAVRLRRLRALRRLASLLGEWSAYCQRIAERGVQRPSPSDHAPPARRSVSKPSWRDLVARFQSPAVLEQLLSRGLIGDDLQRLRGLPAGRKILVLAAHQDDEIIGAGGTFLLLAQAGARFTVVYYTDGATRVAGLEAEDVSRWRRDEATRVWRRLAGVEPIFWNYPNRADALAPDAAKRFSDLIDEVAPDTIFMPTFFEQPTEHSRMTDLLLAANAHKPLERAVEIWGYQITTRVPGNLVVDITSVWKQKFALNRLWATQNAYLDYAHLAMGRDIANSYYLKGRKHTRRAASHAELFIGFEARVYLKIAALFSKEQPPPRPVAPDFFVVGMQKSGSYWLTALLDAHPEIRCFPSRPGHADGTGEAHFFDLIARIDGDYLKFRKLMGTKLGGCFGRVLPSSAPRDARERERLILKLRGRFSAFCRSQRTAANKRLVGEKTTETVLHPELVERLYPGVPKICILRDPRDRAVSFLFHQQRKGRVGEGRALDEAAAAAYLTRVRRDYEGLLAMTEPLHVLTYEGLSAAPLAETERILRFLGVDASPETVASVVAAASFKSLSGREPGEEDASSHFRQGTVGAWTAHLDPALAGSMVEALDELTTKLEARFGLDLSAYRAEPAGAVAAPRR
jgi:LmbE family N-acetylglucosaminyl deacetylase